jgi:hypothetical protein
MPSFNGSVGIATKPKAKESFRVSDMLLQFPKQEFIFFEDILPCIISEP